MINANTTAMFQPDLAADQVRPTRGIMPAVAGLTAGAGSGLNLVGLAVLIGGLFALEHLRPKG